MTTIREQLTKYKQYISQNRITARQKKIHNGQKLIKTTIFSSVFFITLCFNFFFSYLGYYKGPNDGYSYKIHKKSANWHEAKAVCESEGAHLTVVDSQKTFDYIAQLAKKSAKYMWVGAYDKFSNNTWKWINGQMVGKKFWLAGEPNNYNGVREDCMAMYPIGSGGLVDAYCYWNEPTFVCQKKGIENLLIS